MTLTPEKDKLVEELKQRISSSRCWANSYRCASWVVVIAAITASIFATISIGFEWFPKAWNVTLAAVPSLAVGLATVFRFEERCEWWTARHNKFDELRRRLEYEGTHESEVSRELTDYIAEHQSTWPRFGKLPAASAPGGTT